MQKNLGILFYSPGITCYCQALQRFSVYHYDSDALRLETHCAYGVM